MKIAVFTYYNGCNFGAQLQAYSTSRFFESLGHEVWFVDFSKKEDSAFSHFPKEQVEAHNHFVESRLRLTPRLSHSDIPRYIQENAFDVIAFGADAIWNKRIKEDWAVYTAQWVNDANLANKLKVIAISPAFMGYTYSDLTEAECESFKKGIKSFTYLNTRDSWTRDVVNREIMGDDYIRILNPDPVFLLDELCKDKWDSSKSLLLKGSYFAVTLPCGISGFERYIMKKWLRRLNKTLHARGLSLVELPLPEGASGLEDFDITVSYPIDPLQWFLWLKNAKAFIGLRFHAVVSCLSAGTPFYSLDVYGHIPRWLSYLNRLGFHQLDRKLNKGSKIRNLLEGSGLEKYRINGALPIGVSPNRIVKAIENYDMKSLIAFRDKNVSLFKEHMKDALS